MIEFKNFTKIYKNKIILNDITLKLEKGKIHGFIGRNASGKTMLFKAICGFITPTKGCVLVNEKEIGKELDFPTECGVIIEVPGFINNISGYKNLKILASINNKIDSEKINASLSIVGLDPNDKQPVKNYSLGMKQKLAIAQAIMEDPTLLILDEPFNAIDKESVINLKKLLINLKNNGVTILITSHIADDIDSLCDNVYNVSNGNIIKNLIRI